tara:strand:- start:1478 stop:2179 length:702 start_codon:yes stop_codon:yes gene_type:complete
MNEKDPEILNPDTPVNNMSIVVYKYTPKEVDKIIKRKKEKRKDLEEILLTNVMVGRKGKKGTEIGQEAYRKLLKGRVAKRSAAKAAPSPQSRRPQEAETLAESVSRVSSSEASSPLKSLLKSLLKLVTERKRWEAERIANQYAHWKEEEKAKSKGNKGELGIVAAVVEAAKGVMPETSKVSVEKNSSVNKGMVSKFRDNITRSRVASGRRKKRRKGTRNKIKRRERLMYLKIK